jgi:hypothetical protein
VVADAPAICTILNDDAAGFSIDDVAVVEPDTGVSAAIFTVTLSPPSSQTVTVNFATEDDTAQAGSDYVAASGTLTFGPGDTKRPLTILVNADTAVEYVESLRVILSNPMGGPSVAFSPGIATVYDPGTFFTVTPCRLLDTRQPAGPYGGPALSPAVERTFTIAGQCGVPQGAKAVAANVAVTGAGAAGHLRIYPAGTPVPPLVASINYGAGQTRSNNLIFPVNSDGEVSVRCFQGGGNVHLILDVNGYFR